MNIVVWGINREEIEPQINNIIEQYEHFNIEYSKKVDSFNRIFITFSNGDSLKGLIANDANRGTKCHISYISTNVAQDYEACARVRCSTVMKHGINKNQIYMYGL